MLSRMSRSCDGVGCIGLGSESITVILFEVDPGGVGRHHAFECCGTATPRIFVHTETAHPTSPSYNHPPPINSGAWHPSCSPSPTPALTRQLLIGPTQFIKGRWSRAFRHTQEAFYRSQHRLINFTDDRWIRQTMGLLFGVLTDSLLVLLHSVETSGIDRQTDVNSRGAQSGSGHRSDSGHRSYADVAAGRKE